jgi:hypothetical protein
MCRRLSSLPSLDRRQGLLHTTQNAFVVLDCGLLESLLFVCTSDNVANVRQTKSSELFREFSS